MGNIGERVKELRKDKKLSQGKFGANLGLSRSHICNIEKGTRSLNKQTILQICSVYNINRQWLLAGIGVMYKDELDKYNIDDEDVKKFMSLFLKADKITQEFVLDLMEKKAKLEDKLKENK